MRVTHKTLTQDAINHLRQRMEALRDSQERATTLNRVNRPSDDPAAAERLVGLKAEEARLGQFGRNLEHARAFANQTDSSLSQAVLLLTRAKEIAVGSINGSLGPSELIINGHQAEAIKEQMVNVANTEAGGIPIFAGYLVDAAPFDADGNYSGDDNHIELDVAPGTRLEINRTGQQVFVNGGVFTALKNLEDALLTVDHGALKTALGEVDAALRHVIEQQGSFGNTAARLEDTAQDLANIKVELGYRLAEVGDVDFAEAVTQYLTDVQALEATLKITARSLPISLVDLLG